MFVIVFAASADPLDTKGRAATWKKNRRQLVRVKLRDINITVYLDWLLIFIIIMESNKLRQDNLPLGENYCKAQILGATPIALCQNPSFSRILPLTISLLFFLLMPSSWPLVFVDINATDPDYSLSVTVLHNISQQSLLFIYLFVLINNIDVCCSLVGIFYSRDTRLYSSRSISPNWLYNKLWLVVTWCYHVWNAHRCVHISYSFK